MTDRKVIMLAIFLVGILAIGAASAAENTTGDIASSNNQIGDDADSLSQNDATTDNLKTTENDLLTASPKTFTDLNRTINGNTSQKEIYLTEDYTYNPDNDTAFVDGVVIGREVTVYGNGHRLDGNYKARIFNAEASNVVIHDIIFVNGYTKGNGGAMYNGSAINCTFTNNEAKNGGAMYNGSAINCTFTNNCARIEYPLAENCENGGAMAYGSAINCTFTNNTAAIGGAMYQGSATNCTFTNNQATKHGGAMAEGSATNCTFTNNQATSAGAMAEGSATNCTFTNNKANTTGGAMAHGSATNCTFTNNTSYSAGGAMQGGSATNCTFTNNTSYSAGGAMQYGSATNCTFTNNKAERNGGAMYQGSAENSIFKDNHLTNGENNNLERTKSTNCIFISPDATTAGSVAYLEDVVFKAANDIPDNIEKPAIIFNSKNEIITTTNITINGRTVTVSNLNIADNYEICYYNATINDNGDKNYTRVKVSMLKANSTVNAEDVAVIYGNPISIQVTSANATNVTYKITNNKNEIVANGTIKPNDAIVLSTVLPAGNYTVNLTTVVDENHNSATNTSKLTISKGSSEIRITINSEYYVGQKITITLTPVNSTGNINVTINGKPYTVTNNTVEIKDGLANGTYTVKAILNSDDNYKGSSATANFTVIKNDPQITISDIEGNVEDTIQVTVSIGGGDATGIITYDGANYTVEKGEAKIALNLTTAGPNSIDITYSGDGKYNNKTAKKQYEVGKGASTIEIKASEEIMAGENATVNITVSPNKATGKVNITVDGKAYGEPVAINKGIAIIEIAGLANGTHKITVQYTGDANYNASDIAETSITVNKWNLTIEATAETIYVGQNATVVVTGLENAEGNISVRAGDGIYFGSIENGIANVIIPDLIENTTAEIHYSGNGNYTNASTSILIVVKAKENTTISIIAAEITFGEDATVIVTLPEDATGRATVGNELIKLVNGTASAILTNPPAGNITVPVTYSGNYKYNPIEAEITVIVNRANSTLTVENMEFNYGNTGTANIICTGATGVNATVNDPNAIVKVNGTTITVSNLKAGNYILNVTTIPDANHNEATKTANITVKKIRTELAAKSITTAYNTNKKLVISLKDSEGNPISGVKVSVKLGGSKTYKTNKKGQIKVPTKGLTPKTYTAKIRFNGNDMYVKTDKSVKVAVKKAPSKLTAKKKTLKDTDKNKRYAVTLKDSKGQAIKKAKVNLKIKGESYTATTNSRGIAVFKVKLAKETHTATASFKGNKYYNKAKTVKTKITVKVTWKTVSKGSKNKAMVKKIQRALKHNGYYLRYAGHYLMIDGKYNDCTQRSVKEFQKDNNLKVTGKVDYNTAKKLKII